jgi:transcriptional regulator of acetoin/glycerol metabolism
LCDGEVISSAHLPPQFAGPMQIESQEGEDLSALKLALHRCDWNVTAAARLLGISRATVHRRMRVLGLHRP